MIIKQKAIYSNSYLLRTLARAVFGAKRFILGWGTALLAVGAFGVGIYCGLVWQGIDIKQAFALNPQGSAVNSNVTKTSTSTSSASKGKSKSIKTNKRNIRNQKPKAPS